MSRVDYYGLPFDDPRRQAWLDGCAEESRLRGAARKTAAEDVRQLLDYADALVKYDRPQVASVGSLLTAVAYVFSSKLSRADRRAIRRALRGKR